MGTRRSGLRIGVVCAAGAVVAAVSCRDATEVTLVLTTNVPCSMLTGTAISVGSPDNVTTKIPDTQTTLCGPTADPNVNDIGTLVLVPSGSEDESFAVQVVTGVNTPLSSCTATSPQGCIFARRELAFIPHTSLTLPIEMTLVCLGKGCDENSATSGLQTCQGGSCKIAETSCPDGVCGQPGEVPDAAAPTDDAGDEAAPETSVEDTSLPDTSPRDVSSVPDDGTPREASPDVAPPVEASTMDAPPESGPQPGPEPTPEAAVDAPIDVGVDAQHDATVDAPEDAGAGGGTIDGGPPYQVSLGACVTDGTYTGVACSGGRCAPGQVCCAAWYPTVGGPSGTTVESCTTPSACDVNTTGSPIYSALGCRNVGDCSSGVCCVTPSSVTSGFTATCASSCTSGVSRRSACQNTCECAAGTCAVNYCGGFSIGLCGGPCP